MPELRASRQPIVFSPRPEIVDVLRNELKALTGGGIQAASTAQACIEMLVASPGLLLVLDSAHGPEAINQILAAARGFFKIETRPILLLVPELSPELIATGIEYAVGQIHTGEVSRESLRTGLAELLADDESAAGIRDTLVQVAAARQKGDYSPDLLAQLQAAHPGNQRLCCELAENLIQSERWVEAMELLAPLTNYEPVHIRALHLLGRCYMQTKDYDAAIGLLSRAKLMNPNHLERLIELGGALLANDQAAEAKEQFKEALALDEDSPEAKAGLGTSLLMTGEVNEALALFKDSSGPREVAAIFNTAAILAMRRGHYQQGMHLYRSALTKLGKDDRLAARLLFNMGLGYRRWSQPDKAQVCFERSLALDPGFSKAAKHVKKLAHTSTLPEAADDVEGELSLHEMTPRRPTK